MSLMDFTLSSVQVWNIVKKYGRMVNVDIHPTHSGTALPSTWSGQV
jgi:hypothetical protein